MSYHKYKHHRQYRGNGWITFSKGAVKVLLSLLVLLGLGLLCWWGYLTFTYKDNPIFSTVVFLLGIAAWILLVWFLRYRYSKTKPSFKLIIFLVVFIIFVAAFAGVEPISSYKDEVINKWNTYWSEQKIKTEENQLKAKLEEEKRIEQQKIEEQKKLAEQKVKEAQIQAELNQSYAQLFNEFRTQNGKRALIFDSKLNELARQRAIEISQPGNFSHEGIKGYNYGENIAMMAHSTDSNTSLLELWATSPGHRSNMLSSTYSRTGFARAGRYAVQIFD